MKEHKPYIYFDTIMAVFVTILVVSNIASSAKIVDLGIHLFGGNGLKLVLDAGTLLFPVSYIFGDILTEVYGYRNSRKVIWTGFGCLILSSLIFWIVRYLPGEPTWQEYAGDAAYVAILGGMSSGGIVLASLAGYWIGEFSNSFTLAKMKIWTRGKFLWLRTIGSTIIGEFLDTIVFILIACLFKIFPWSLFWGLAIANYLFKCAIEFVMTPVTYLIVRKLKNVENEDYYDTGTNFNPFRS
jgi:uncharacterized integral membrane protein (TIGR00697 family)